MKTLCMSLPDDWHVHLRDAAFLEYTVSTLAQWAGRAVVMPNLTPPVKTIERAFAYKNRILRAIPQRFPFLPLMTILVDEHTTHQLILAASESKLIHSAKLYPECGRDLKDKRVGSNRGLFNAIATMEEVGLPLSVHAESNDEEIDVFDREDAFLTDTLQDIVRRFPRLRITIEHISTRTAVDFVLALGPNVAATITPQHLLYNRNDLLGGRLHPHMFCSPILKSRGDQEALLQAVASGHARFFIGTDSAPFPLTQKESAAIPAGCYSTPYAIELYAEVFESINALDKLESFLSHNGPDFFGLQRNTEMVVLRRQRWKPKSILEFADSEVVPLRKGNTLNWRLLPRDSGRK